MIWIILPFLFLQVSNAIKFTELKGNDLKGNEVSFEKYENKCVLLVYLSPIIRNPTSQVEELNKLHDKYNGKGKSSIYEISKLCSIVCNFFYLVVSKIKD